MSVFDTLAESRYQEWLEKVSAPGYKPPSTVVKTVQRSSYETYLYREVLALLDEAGKETGTQKSAECLEKSLHLEFQLVLLLEKRQLPYVAAMLRESIGVHRRRVLTEYE